MPERSGAKWLERTVWALFGLLLLWIFASVFLFREVTCQCILSLPVRTAIGVAVMACGGICLLRWGERGERALARWSRIAFPLCVLAVLVFQLVYCYYAYFLTGWDSFVVVNNARCLADGSPEAVWQEYYQMYPNNVLLTCCYAVLLRLEGLLGGAGIYILLAAQCVLSAISGALLFLICRDLTGSHRAAWGAWLIWALFLGTSPWVMIPYSDASGAAFPLAVLRLYQRRGEGRWDLARWFAMGLLTYVGFQVKPQLGIPAIAVVLTELAGLLADGSRRARAVALAKRMGAFALAMAVGLAVMTWIVIPASRIELDREKVVGPAHFFMMGLREETCGGYSSDDVTFSTSFATAAERQAADLAVAGERLKALGPGGVLRHLSRKTAFVYGDGTFAWGIEGQFYHQLLPERDGLLSPFFRGIFYGDGKNNPAFVAFQQVMWMGVLTGMWGLIVAYLRRERLPRELMAAALTVLGVTAFTLLFEARARYLYAFAGTYVLLGAMGWRWLLAGKKTPPANPPAPEGEPG